MKFWFGLKKSPVGTPEKVVEPSVSGDEKAAVSASAGVSENEQAHPEPPPPPHLGVMQLKSANPAPAVAVASDAPAVSAPASVAPAPVPPPPAPVKPATGEGSLVRPQANQKVLYYQLMNGLYDAVLILDDNGHIVDCNKRVEAILGYTRDEMWDMPVVSVLKSVGPQIFQQMKDALHGNHQVLINAKCTRKDGITFQGEVGVCLMTLTRGENLVFTIRNVEKRIAAMREKLIAELKSTPPPPPAKPRLVLKKSKPQGAVVQIVPKKEVQ